MLKKSCIGNGLWRRACLLKWAFNAKADLVIHTTPDSALCVELKLESKEDRYSMTRKDDSNTKLAQIKLEQIKLQRYVLKQLLGLETHFALISK